MRACSRLVQHTFTHIHFTVYSHVCICVSPVYSHADPYVVFHPSVETAKSMRKKGTYTKEEFHSWRTFKLLAFLQCCCKIDEPSERWNTQTLCVYVFGELHVKLEMKWMDEMNGWMDVGDDTEYFSACGYLWTTLEKLLPEMDIRWVVVGFGCVGANVTIVQFSCCAYLFRLIRFWMLKCAICWRTRRNDDVPLRVLIKCTFTPAECVCAFFANKKRSKKCRTKATDVHSVHMVGIWWQW